MRILLHRADGKTEPWIKDFTKFLPEAEFEIWHAGETSQPCDYAVVWSPPEAMLPELAQVKAIFNTGAGVDALLRFGDANPREVPIIRLGDAGMAVQMAEYVTYSVLRYFRRFDEYEAQARFGLWAPLPQHVKSDFPIGVLGMGVLGTRVLEALAPFGFPLRGWSRSEKRVPGVQCYHGSDGLDTFLRGSRVLVCMLPLTPETARVLQVVIAGKVATAYGPDLYALRRGGAPAALEGAKGGTIRWDPTPTPLPDTLNIVSEAGQPLAQLAFQSCGEAPTVKAAPVARSNPGTKPKARPKAAPEAPPGMRLPASALEP